MQISLNPSTLYEQCGPHIYSYLRRLTQDAALAEELTQDTFLRALEHLQTFRCEGSVSNWLYRIATNLFCDYLRLHKGKEPAVWDNGEDAEGTEDLLARIPDPAPPLRRDCGLSTV